MWIVQGRGAVALPASFLLAFFLCGGAPSANAQAGQQQPHRQRRVPVRYALQSTLGVLAHTDVQKHLEMTPEQITKMGEREKELRISILLAAKSARLGTPEEQQSARDDVWRLQARIARDVLDDKQYKRYEELAIQWEGTTAMFHKSVSEKLGLTDDQRNQMRQVQDEGLKQARAAMKSVDPLRATQKDREAFVNRIKENQQTVRTRMEAVLTDDQKRTWKEMQGATYAFTAATAR